MAEGLVTDLLKQLASITAQEAELIVGVDEEVQELKDKLRIIQAVMDDAKERQVTQHDEMHWLDQLKDAYYKMDDMLDDWNTARIKLEIEKEEENAADDINAAPAVMKNKKVLCSFFPSPSFCFRHVKKLALRHDIGHKIKKLSETLDKIVKDRVLYGFDLTRQLELVAVKRPKTTSFVDASDIIGRVKDKVDLVSNLLGKSSQEERSPHVISLVGIGGIGKTTLAQLSYNDNEVKTHFVLRMWVCVSDPFDQCKVARAIIESAEGNSPDITEFPKLLEKICNLIQGKKFFLVLDDVWNEDHTKWEPFKNALKCGARGSRILVTTRNEKIAEMMQSAHIINLGVLSEKDCLLMFSKIAFFDMDEEVGKQLEDLGKKIAKKCRGFPLAIKILGSHMRLKRSREQWEGVLRSSVWELENVERGLFAPLLLSYYDFPSPMKRCFSYCVVFPKDYLFSKDQLVLQWMAQGYIESKENMEMEVIAGEYFENLAICSFFQDFEKDNDNGEIISYKMHDVVHDFAKSITTNECLEINGDNKLEIDCKSVHHLCLKNSKETQFLQSVYEAKNLRTLCLISDEWNREFNMPLYDLFHHFRCLRTLILDFPIKKVPDAIENLIHLRCLLMSNHVRIEELPETICNLYNLQTLSIKNCNGLKKLPLGMGKLINLRHLSISSFPYWEHVIFPKGIGKLISLRTLSSFNLVGKDDTEVCKLGELKNLNHLRGVLHIKGLENVVDVCEAENAQLNKKIHLRGLVLMYGQLSEREDEKERRMKSDVLILNALEPHLDLESLHLYFYLGTTMYPNWMMSLTKLKTLHLILFSKLECLPPLGNLPSLETLKILRLDSLKKVGVEFLGIESQKKKNDDIIIIFPKLKFLDFLHLKEWEEWIGIGGMREEKEDNGVTIIMPRLHSLSIGSCPKLKSLPDFLRTTPLKELKIYQSPILKQRCQRGTGEEWPKISHIPNINIG